MDIISSWVTIWAALVVRAAASGCSFPVAVDVERLRARRPAASEAQCRARCSHRRWSCRAFLFDPLTRSCAALTASAAAALDLTRPGPQIWGTVDCTGSRGGPLPRSPPSIQHLRALQVADPTCDHLVSYAPGKRNSQSCLFPCKMGHAAPDSCAVSGCFKAVEYVPQDSAFPLIRETAALCQDWCQMDPSCVAFVFNINWHTCTR
eukprot:Polyplicarium_translucidae@DN3245_c1_g1_i10.p1